MVLVCEPQLTQHEKEVHLRDAQLEMLSSWARFPAQYNVVTKVIRPLVGREDSGLVDPASEVR